MEFVEIKEKEYEKYWETHPLKTFLSSPDIANYVKRAIGWLIMLQ